MPKTLYLKKLNDFMTTKSPRARAWQIINFIDFVLMPERAKEIVGFIERQIYDCIEDFVNDREGMTYQEFLETYYPKQTDNCKHCFCQINNLFELKHKCCQCGKVDG